ncbi:unnamed protein product [Schistosoma margrebowiei]|uniref:DUF7041 domain-containing protein n=1 Tax=Schistosoma margrebowiei TaxID=48269 RepID=A0A183NBW0_9TREM|nr:unnamed protein product [Schistosoma margrebowiei]
MPFWPDNIEAWSCYAEADFHEHGVNDTRAQFLAVITALPRKFNRYVTPSMFTSDVSEPYETLKRSFLKQADLTDRQSLDQLSNNIDLQHGSVTGMLQRMREVIGLRTFDEGLFKQHFLSKLLQQVQAVLVSFQNKALDELAASADRILEITKSSTSEIIFVENDWRPTRVRRERCDETANFEFTPRGQHLTWTTPLTYQGTIDALKTVQHTGRYYRNILVKIVLNKMNILNLFLSLFIIMLITWSIFYVISPNTTTHWIDDPLMKHCPSEDSEERDYELCLWNISLIVFTQP